MGSGQYHRGLESNNLRNIRPQRTNCFAGHEKRSKQPTGQAKPVQQLAVPFLSGSVDQAGTGGVGVFLLLYAGQQVMKVIRNHQQAVRSLQLFGMLLLQGHKLVNGVEALLLDSGAGIKFSGGDFRLNQAVDAVGAAVPVGDRLTDTTTVLV